MVDLLFYGFLHSAWMREILYPIVHCFKQNSILEVSGPGAQTIESAQPSPRCPATSIAISRVHVPSFTYLLLLPSMSRVVHGTISHAAGLPSHRFFHYHNPRLHGATPLICSCPFARDLVF